VHLTPRENERLQLFTAAELARRRRSRGRRLNAPEAVALICDEVLEAAWDGLSMDEVIAVGRSVLTEDDVMEGVPALVPTVQVEALFPSGTALVAVDAPIGPAAVRPDPADHGRTGTGPVSTDRTSTHRTPSADPASTGPAHAPRTAPDPPGAVRTAAEPVRINEGRRRMRLTVRNNGDRAVYVSSHYPLDETNAALAFDREAAAGMRLDIPAGTALVFEPGGVREVDVVEART
jgi:urease subunit gamma/beta